MKKIAVFLLLASVALGSARASGRIPRFTLSVAVAGLGIADTALTIYGTKRGLVETNGLLSPFFERGRALDYFAVWNIQMAGSALIIIGANLLISRDAAVPKIAGYALLVSAIVFRGFVVARNARLNRGLK